MDFALLHYYGNININYGDVIDEFAKSKRRNDFALKLIFLV